MKSRFAVLAALLFILGVAVGYAAKKVDPPTYRSKSKQEAAKALLEQAEQPATWVTNQTGDIGNTFRCSVAIARDLVVAKQVQGRGASIADSSRTKESVEFHVEVRSRNLTTSGASVVLSGRR